MGIYPSPIADLTGAWALPGGDARGPEVFPGPGRHADSSRIPDFEIDAHLRSSLSETLVRRARFVVGFLTLSCVFFFGTRLLTGEPIAWLAQAVRAGNFVALLALFPLLSGARAVSRSRMLTLFACCLSLGCAAVVCTIEGDSVNTGLSVAVISVSTAAFVPWALGYQLALAVFGAFALVANQVVLGTYHHTVESITGTTAILAILSTIVMSVTLERARRRGAIDEIRRRRAESRLREAYEALEQRVAERTTELREAMQELQAFNYSVSHDLRGPLRHINGMSQLLEDEYAASLDETAMTYLGRLKTAAGRMGQLIDALLARSRVGQAEMHPDEVDLAALADTVLEDLRAGEPGRQVEWVPPPSLFVDADRTLMAVVLQHLIGNAWKFTRGRARGRIELGELCIGGRREIYVRDNGVGFSMEHAGKLFENFQRLHGEEYEGTGIGLATVARIVARHGGSVRLQSTPDKGTTVYFTLADTPSQAVAA